MRYLSFVILVLGLSPRMTRGSKAKRTSRMTGHVTIVTNHKHGTLYIGVTSDLERRIYEHREALTPGFTAKYGCRQLVWYEEHYTIADAIQREKSLKRWYRRWKIELIESFNPQWQDLYEELVSLGVDPRVKPEDDEEGGSPRMTKGRGRRITAALPPPVLAAR